VRPGSDTLQSLVEYMAHFANELFDGSPMPCRLELPPDIPVRQVPPDVRHNIFLIAKEALTNALKHANGTIVHLQVRTDVRGFDLVVADDGKGFDVSSTTADGRRNGMENMRRRAEALGGRLTVTSGPSQGTRVELHMDFPG